MFLLRKAELTANNALMAPMKSLIVDDDGGLLGTANITLNCQAGSA